jgi:hypothetical protein
VNKYDVQRIKDIQEKLACTMECIEKARQEGCKETLEACEYLAASYTAKLGQLIEEGNDTSKLDVSESQKNETVPETIPNYYG